MTSRRLPLSRRLGCAGLALSACMTSGAAVAADAVDLADPAEAKLKELQQRVGEQIRRVEELRRQLDAEEPALRELQRTLAQRLQQTPPVVSPTLAPMPQAPDPVVASSPVIQDPNGTVRSAAVAPIFEESGVLTPRGGFVFEPALQYSYSSNNRVTLLGYTILPALVVGLVDVREVKRNTFVGVIGLRYGLSPRLELEARVPYLYRSDATVSRPYGVGSPQDITVNASGRSIGDVELAARYQLTNGMGALPILIGSLRVKSRTGTDPFEVVSDCNERCVGNATGTGQPLQLPTGSGFYSLQPGLTWLLASDPAVLFGSFSYLHSFARTVSRRVLNDQVEPLGRIAPGDVFGFNVGLGLALNERSSFSIGYDHSSVAATRQNGEKVSGSVRTQLGTLLFGYSYRMDKRRSLNFSLGAGLTTDTPSLTLGLKMPVSF